MIVDTIPLIYDEIKKGSNILVEGANATMLDIDFGMTICLFSVFHLLHCLSAYYDCSSLLVKQSFAFQ